MLLLGCSPRVIYIAAECPTPSMLPISPSYTTEELLETATSKEVIEAYVLDLDACQSHTEQLENTLNAYGAAYKEYKARNLAIPK